ncbi:MAG: flagellar motor protein MotB [Solirubrobacteraceae bacterium]|nr:flagellar motor protein MotB [Solirubrobacteraceae bacterium]
MSRKHKKHAHEEHPDERWLLTYADMITLLMALFIVMFSISSVNKGKFDELSKSLNSAFNGPPVFSGGEAIKETGGEAGIPMPASEAPRPSLQAAFAPKSTGQAASAAEEQEDLEQLERMVRTAAIKAGISDKVQTEISPDGLTVRLKTDGLLFDSGSAAVKPQAVPLIRDLARVLRADGRHAIMVSGHTDSQPVSGQYPTNWELSTARAAAVVRQLASAKVSPARLTATGRAFYDPISTNATISGRAANRRVELFLPRSQAAPGGAAAASASPESEGAAAPDATDADAAKADALEQSDSATRFSESAPAGSAPAEAPSESPSSGH